MIKLFKVLKTGCTCLTKTPDTEYHKVGCAYKTVWENYHKGENKLNRYDWIDIANKYLISRVGESDENDWTWDYCESLYESYVEKESFSGDYWTPEEAVDEDMTYWGD